jgi:hypothetical protein
VDTVDVVIANVEELRRSGWDAVFQWDPDLGGQRPIDTKIEALSIAARNIQTVTVDLIPYGGTQSKVANVLVVAYSRGDVSVSYSKYFTVAYPELNPYSTNMTVFGDEVYEQPTGIEAANAGVMVVAVAASLIIFYVARKKRWLR